MPHQRSPRGRQIQSAFIRDDCLLYREINSFSDHTALQEDLRSLEAWASKWEIVFNATKCYIMTLARKPPSNFFYFLDNTIIKSVSTNPYLGVQFSNDLKWSAHINYLCKKANSTLAFLRRNLKRCPSSCRRNAYLALVRQFMEYNYLGPVPKARHRQTGAHSAKRSPLHLR
jgi:hypothetical protein